MYNWYYQNSINRNTKSYCMKKNITATPEIDQTLQFGYLDVNVSDPDGKPIKDAIVSLFVLDRFKGQTPVQAARTNEDGDIKSLSVPVAYDVAYDIGTTYLLTTYNIRADAYGYYSFQVDNIRFYPGITTSFNIILYPITIKIPGINLEQRVQLPPSKFD